MITWIWRGWTTPQNADPESAQAHAAVLAACQLQDEW
jgi:hypothetical protein